MKREMKKILTEIQHGEFAKEFILEIAPLLAFYAGWNKLLVLKSLVNASKNQKLKQIN